MSKEAWHSFFMRRMNVNKMTVRPFLKYLYAMVPCVILEEALVKALAGMIKAARTRPSGGHAEHRRNYRRNGYGASGRNGV